MDKIIKNVLKKIENNGYEAYIVGGFVRDKLLGSNSYDVDICTNAVPKELVKIFNLSNTNMNEYGGVRLKIKKYNIDITTYRKEVSYNNRRPVEIEYVSSLIEDVKRRDFTINTLCMDKKENVIDILEGKVDLNNRIIKSIGNPDEKFIEDPLRMLRAIRFATILNFEIEMDTYKSIVKHASLVSSLSDDRIKDELSKILSNPNFQYGLDLLKSTKISETISLVYDKVVYTSDLIGMWSQISCPRISFNKNEESNIKIIKQIINIGSINSNVLFNNGLYLSIVSGEILGVSHKEVNSIYNKMAIHSMKDIDISGKEIMGILNIGPDKLIGEILLNIKHAILNGEIKNKKVIIKKYIISRWKQNE